MKKNVTISIIGAGSMGGSIACSICLSKKNWDVTVIDPHPEKLSNLKKDCPSVATSDEYSSVMRSDIVILAVKPQSFAELAKTIAALIPKKSLVISIMAGRSVRYIQQVLPGVQIIRAMPNLGTRSFQSMTVWTGNLLSRDNKALAKTLFALIGEELFVPDEDFVDKATAVSASGIGFFAYIVEVYLAETIAMGFTQEKATMIVLQTLRATSTLLQKGDRTPAQLRSAVASKKGTTEAGLAVLAKKQFSGIISKTLKKAYERAKELSE